MRMLLVTAITIFLLPIAHAQESSFSSKFHTCVEQNGSSGPDAAGCIIAETRSQESRMRGAYSAAVAAVPPKTKAALSDVQSAWLKYRELTCNFFDEHAAPMTERNGPINRMFCVLQMTANRADELEDIASSY